MSQILDSIEDFISNRSLLLITKEQVEGRHQACMELDDKCAPEFLQAMGVSKAEGLFRKMRAAHSKDNKTGIAFTENYAHKCRREGVVYKALLGLFEFKDMPQDQPCALKIWSYANENQVDIVQLWRDTLVQVGGNAKLAKKFHVIDAFTLGNLHNQVTDLQTQLQTQTQQNERQVAQLVAARVAEETERMQADYQKNLEEEKEKREAKEREADEKLEAQKKEADEKLEAQKKELLEAQKKELEDILSNRGESFQAFAEKNAECERLKKQLEEQGTRLALARTNSEFFGTPAQGRRDSTTSDTTLVDSTRGTKRSTADTDVEMEKLKKRLKIADKYLERIDTNAYLAYYKNMDVDGNALVAGFDELCQLFKVNKECADKNQPPKYEIKIHHDSFNDGKVMTSLEHWKGNAWSQLKWLVEKIGKVIERKDECYSDLEFEESVDGIIAEGGS